MRKLLLLVAVAALFVASVPEVVEACPLGKAGRATARGAARVGKGVAKGVRFILPPYGR